MPDPFDPLAGPAAPVARHPGLLHAPATARNRAALCQALADLLPTAPCKVLELASGPGNAAFDADLRRRNPGWGLRDRADIDDQALAHGFAIAPRRMMPADNRLLVYCRQ